MISFKKFKSKIKILFVLLLSVISLKSNIYALEETEIKNFYNSTLQNGYINLLVDIKENINDNIEFTLLFKENILGIDYGFYTTPYVLEVFKNTGYQPDLFFDEEYACIKVEAKIKNLNALFSTLNCLPFLEFEGYNNSKETIFSGRLTNSQFTETRNSDSVVDKIYATNKVVFSYTPNIISRSNSQDIDSNNKHTWVLSGDQENDTEIAFLKEKNNAFIFISLCIIILSFGIIIFIIFKIKSNSKNYNLDNYYEDPYNNYY